MKFQPIDRPYMYGRVATSESGIDIEVVQCYEGLWDVFLTRHGSVVACSVEAYRQWQHGYAPKTQVMQVARTLLNI